MDAGGVAEAAANGGIEGSADPCNSGTASGHRLSVHQIAGGGKGPLFFPQLPMPPGWAFRVLLLRPCD
jgi:hypothetical protein